MRNLSITLLFLFFFTFTSWSQKETIKSNFGITGATIYLVNGETYTGDLDYPLSLDVTKIKWKEKGNKQSFKIEDIEKIIYETTGKTPIEYYVLPVFKDKSDKIRSGKILAQLVIKGKKVNLYMNSFAGGGGFGAGMNYYCKRENEPAMTLLNVDTRGIGFGIYFKKYAPIYFADNPTIVNKIKNGDYISKNFIEMVIEYNEAP